MSVELRYSGGLNNKFAITSLGGAISTKVIPDATLENLFDDVNRVEVINGRIEHRCFYIKNISATNFYRSRFITLVIPADTEIAYAVNDRGSTPQLLATEDSVPIGLYFLQFKEWNTLEIPIGTFDIGDEVAIWLRRKVTLGSDSIRTVSIVIDGQNNVVTSTGDFSSIENSHDNDFIKNRSPQYFCDIDLVGESLLS